MGHYTGLTFLGREVMNTYQVPLFVQLRMAEFLSTNGPWKQLIDVGNVILKLPTSTNTWELNDRIKVEAVHVPHRDEYSETVGFVVRGPSRSIMWLPDIDSWSEWDHSLEAMLERVDRAWLDGTFWADGELARDMTAIPHPRISETMMRRQAQPERLRSKVRFVHLNHTNPAIFPDSDHAKKLQHHAMDIAAEGEIFSL